MKNKAFWLVFLFLCFPVLTLFTLFNFLGTKQNKACFKNHCFYLELAITPDERSRGLMFRKSLGPREGMLFIFETEGKHNFWMKNTLIPLDIIWISKNGEVVFIKENAQPCKEDYCLAIVPDKDAKYVLEINGGISKEIGLNTGDKISLEIKREDLI